MRVPLHILTFIASRPLNINKDRKRAEERKKMGREKLRVGGVRVKMGREINEDEEKKSKHA